MAISAGGLGLPLLYGSEAYDRLAFVPYNGVLGEALREERRIAPVFGGNVAGNGFWQMDGHPGSPSAWVMCDH
jgi:hypothetical protein